MPAKPFGARLCQKRGQTLSGHTVFPEFSACPPKGQTPFLTEPSLSLSSALHFEGFFLCSSQTAHAVQSAKRTVHGRIFRYNEKAGFDSSLCSFDDKMEWLDKTESAFCLKQPCGC
jgi:hypothetical protein